MTTGSVHRRAQESASVLGDKNLFQGAMLFVEQWLLGRVIRGEI